MKTLIRQWGWIFVVGVIAAGWGWWNSVKRGIAEKAAADVRIEQLQAKAAADSSKAAALTDSLAASRASYAAADLNAKMAFTAYDELRTTVREFDLAAARDSAQLVALADSLKRLQAVVVTRSFVESAESVRQACGVLQLECARAALHADSVIAVKDRQLGHKDGIIEQLQLVQKKKGGRSLLDIAIGAATGYGVCSISR